MAGGGGTQSDSALVAALLRAGHLVTFVAPTSGKTDGAELTDARLRRRLFRRPQGPKAGRATPLIEWALLQLRFVSNALRAVRHGGQPDLVYGFGTDAVPAAAIVGRLLGAPSVGKLFGTFLFPALGSRRRLLAQFEEAIAFKSPVDALVVHDDGTRGDAVAAALGVSEKRLHFWRNGVDKAACRAARAADGRQLLGILPDVPLLVSTCRHVRWKRVDRVIELVARVHPEAPNAVLVITGDGPERAHLEALVDRLGVRGNVIFTGPLERQTNLEVIAAADLYCSFYEYSNVSSALLEALTCGVCVLIGDAGGTAEVVEDQVTGRVVSDDEPAAAFTAALSLFSDREHRAQLAGAAAAWADVELDDLDDRMQRELLLVERLLYSRRRKG